MKDCCGNKINSKGGINMDRNLILWITIGILALLVIYAVFFRDTGVATTAGQAAQSAQIASSGMVGGC